MGKNRRTQKRRAASPPRDQKQSAAIMSQPRSRQAPASASLPLPFPAGLAVPENSFLRNQDPYKEAFQAAIDTSYEGFVVDMPRVIREPTEETIQDALNRLEELGFFRTDVTQPFGLGTKCAKTYVTRCLLGDRGTTYKYLGLRMFSHPWNSKSCDEEAVQVIYQLNESLTKRTEHHLSELCTKRSKRGGTVQGRAGFDICLVNRMEHSPELKEEPSLGEGKCAVSWHADSSLEHYSTIAVYQTIVGNDDSDTTKDSWSVALRVAHHAEGPESSRRGTDIQSSLVDNTPNLSITLPSGSAYYLLDDFNHHHQHAVVSGGSSSDDIRYSCTYRLLRASHNVNFILERCKKVCSSFHKKGSKIWRLEQLLLTEIESEWIRQFYIQGKQHYDLQRKHWGHPISKLVRHWGQLETRTKQTIDFLQLAAEARCGIGAEVPPASKAERKKRKKALDQLEELISRIGTPRTSAIQSLYEPMADLLRERAEMRRLWQERENDHVFRELDRSQRPLSVPFVFDSATTNKNGDGSTACSPMPEDLGSVADRLVALGQACASCDPRHLPTDCPASTNAVSQRMQVQGTALGLEDSVKNAHYQSQTWEGWSERQFGLEMQVPWARLLLQGKKTIETRSYELPPALLGRRIEILQSKQGNLSSSLGDVVPIADEKNPAVTRVGWCTFTRVIRYEDSDVFDADHSAHLVTKDSSFYPFGKEKQAKVLFGWVVGDVGYDTSNDCSLGRLKTIIRRYRSLFELEYAAPNSETVAVSTKKRKKRRRY